MDALSKWITIAGCGALGFFVLMALIGPFLIPHASILVMAMFAYEIPVPMTVVGSVWSVVVPFTKNAMCGLMNLFVSFYGLYYVASGRDEMRRPFLLNFAGVGLLVVTSFTSALALPEPQKVKGDNPAAGPRGGAFPPPGVRPGQVRPPR